MSTSVDFVDFVEINIKTTAAVFKMSKSFSLLFSFYFSKVKKKNKKLRKQEINQPLRYTVLVIDRDVGDHTAGQAAAEAHRVTPGVLCVRKDSGALFVACDVGPNQHVGPVSEEGSGLPIPKDLLSEPLGAIAAEHTVIASNETVRGHIRLLGQKPSPR